MRDEYEQRFMDTPERLRFREKVVSRGAFNVSVGLALLFGVWGLFNLGRAAAGTISPADGVVLCAWFTVLAALIAALGVLFSVSRTIVTDSHLQAHFGWMSRKIPLSAIESARVIELRGFRHGKVAVGLDGVVRTWMSHSKSGRGVEIVYREGSRVLTIGSEDPEHFVAALERAREVAHREPVPLRVGEDPVPPFEESSLERTEDAALSRPAKV